MSARLIRTSWADVTLGEYAALDIIRRTDAETVLNAVWDDMDANNPFSDGEPTRLTEAGRAWLAGLHETYVTTLDERELIAIARDFVKSMGTLVTMAAARRIKSRSI